MTSFAPVIIVLGIFAVLIIGFLMIMYQPEKWVPPPKRPASREEIQRRAQKSVDDAKNLASQGKSTSRDVNNSYRRAA
jgi:hypothetical protein